MSSPPTDRPDPMATLNRRRFLEAASIALAGSGVHWTFASAQDATPTPGDSGPLSSLMALLSYVPARLAREDVARQILFYHADLKAQFAALGIDRSVADWLDDLPIVETTLPLALATTVFMYAANADFVKALGFQPYDVDRSLETNWSPAGLAILQGGLDRDRLEAAWTASAYTQIPLEGGLTMWSKGENGEMDASDPVARFGAGAFNNLLLLDDQTLAIARKGEVIRSVATHATVDAYVDASMAGMPQVRQAVEAMLPDTASSIVVDGSYLALATRVNRVPPGTTAFPTPAASAEATPLMPATLVAAFGVEAGATAAAPRDDAGTPTVLPSETPAENVRRAQIRLVTASEADARQAVDVASERWMTMEAPRNRRPYDELMALLSAEVSATDPTVAAFDFDQGENGGYWINLLVQMNLLPFAPGSL
ncbi:MAG: hypothetical protein QM589_14955 [Thermomicrobiales bacterium]